jgi:hypothetical protein
MPALEVTEMWSKPAHDVRLQDNFRKLTVKLQRAYQITSTPNAVEWDIYQATGIPAAGSSFSEDFPFVYADGASLERVSPVLWMMTVDYNGELGPSERDDPESPANPNNPIMAPPRIDWDDVESEEEIDEDFDGKPIQTVNREPIEGVKALIPDQTVSIKRNMISFSPYVQARYRRAVNSDNFLGWPPGTAKLMKFSASNVFGETGGYWEITAQIRFRYPYRTTAERAWYARVRHEGFYEKIDISALGQKRIVRAVDGNKEPMTRKVLLTSAGYRLPEPAEGEQQIANWLEFKLYDSLPFNALGLL